MTHLTHMTHFPIEAVLRARLRVVCGGGHIGKCVMCVRCVMFHVAATELKIPAGNTREAPFSRELPPSEAS
jgi:hypothetical protein